MLIKGDKIVLNENAITENFPALEAVKLFKLPFVTVESCYDGFLYIQESTYLFDGSEDCWSHYKP